MFDLLVLDGLVVDGTGVPGYKADIGIKNGLIKEIGSLQQRPAKETIHAHGLIVSPGFIDSHTHSDLALLQDPSALAKVSQGVTTEVVGNCGMSVAPVHGEALQVLQEYVKPILGDGSKIWDWQSFEEYVTKLEEAHPTINVALLVGHGTLRTMAMGFENRAPSDDEMRHMENALRKAMEKGALGISTGLGYPPGIFAKTEELIGLAKVVSAYGGIYATHLRDQVDGLIESVEEALKIGEEAEVSVVISHHKTVGKANSGKVSATLDMLDRAEERGVRTASDIYPYIAGSTTLSAIFPPWSVAGGLDRLFERIRSAEYREQIKRDFERGLPGWENRSKAIGWENIVISYVGSEVNSDLAQMSLAEASVSRGLNPADVAMDLMLKEKGNVGVLFNNSTEADLLTVIKHPRTMIGSDGIPVGPNPHPRLYATFPKFLGEYVRDKKVLTIEEGIRRITGLPAKHLHIEGVGLLKEGYQADLTVFNLSKINATADYTNSRRLAEGIDCVIVGGKIVYQGGRLTGVRDGKVLRRSST